MLGWVAGEIMVKDAALASYLGAAMVDKFHLWAAAAGAVFVVAAGWLIRRVKHKTAAGSTADRRLRPDRKTFRETSKRAARDRA